MPWKPDIPPPEVVEVAFPRDVFGGATSALDRMLWLDVPESERQDTLLQRGGEVENLLEEVIVIWNRIGDDRIAEIEARRELYELADKLGLGNYKLGDGSHPELEEIWYRELAAEIQLRVDYKSLFVFGDLLVAAYITMSEPIWEAPASVRQQDGTTAFITSVQKLRAATHLPEVPQPFAGYMDVLLDPLISTDRLLGFYRDKFIVHLGPDMFNVGGGGSMAIPLDFHVEHAPRKEVAEAELRRLRKALRQVEKAEGLDLGSDEPDPRPRLQAMANRIDELTQRSSVETVQNLLKEWGVTSPPVLKVARALNSLLELWAKTFIDSVGLVEGA
jgi:hypothetical protein